MSDLLTKQKLWLVEQLARQGRGARSALAAHLGVRADAITRMTNMEAGKELREISFPELLGIADFFKADPPGLDAARKRDDPSAVNHNNWNNKSYLELMKPNHRLSQNEGQAATTTPGQRLVGNADLPVFGTVEGGKGALIVTDQPVDWVVRPAPLLRVRDGYGMIVTGDSMSPMHKSGSIALVNPHLPPRQGDTCVFRNHADDGAVIMVLKELRKQTETTWHVRQYNPPKDFTLPRSEWQVCHVTVGNYFAR